jgi:HlyD family secretion protein
MNRIPRPLIAVVMVAVVAAIAWLLLRSGSSDDQWLGYVEGEALYIGAPQAGRLASRPVERGTRVAVGAPLFSLDTVTTDAETQRSQAQVTQAQAQVADLEAARQRQAEVDVWRAQERSASAQLAKAQRDFDRESQLVGEGISSRAQVDAARAARDSAQASLDQARAQVRAGEMSAGRDQQIRAAQAGVTGAQAALRGQEQRRADIAPTSPAAGMIEQTFYNPGEWVPANMPVVAVLPDNKRKLRFYVPEERVASLRMGSTVRFTCDGCGAAREARVSYISPRAEFTPPVIYSERARAKLVFLVEALPTSTDKPLPPGLPVEVQPQ